MGTLVHVQLYTFSYRVSFLSSLPKDSLSEWLWTWELCTLNRWFMSHAMKGTIKFWNYNITYFIHLQTFPCPLFHPRPNIPNNWQLACYKHTNSLKSCLYMWLHCSGSMCDYIAVSVWLHEEQWLQIRSALTGLHQIAGIMRPVSTLIGRVPPEKWKQCEHRKIKPNSSRWELIAGNGQIFEKRICHKKFPDRTINGGMLMKREFRICDITVM